MAAFLGQHGSLTIKTIIDVQKKSYCNTAWFSNMKSQERRKLHKVGDIASQSKRQLPSSKALVTKGSHLTIIIRKKVHKPENRDHQLQDQLLPFNHQTKELIVDFGRGRKGNHKSVLIDRSQKLQITGHVHF